MAGWADYIYFLKQENACQHALIINKEDGSVLGSSQPGLTQLPVYKSTGASEKKEVQIDERQ